MKKIIIGLSRIFDALEHRWETKKSRAMVGTGVTVGYLLALIIIHLNSIGWLTGDFEKLIPKSHFAAIDVAFTLFLIFEVVTLVFSLVQSVADSVGKQFEVFSLILLRDTFREFSRFHEPLLWEEIREALLPIFATAMGALIIFLLLGYFYHAQKHIRIVLDEGEINAFINVKKLIALLLLVSFGYIGLSNAIAFIQTGAIDSMFEPFYTLLIFSDILMVLISLRYSSSYHVAFRNSGFAVSTVLIRLALIAPPEISAGIGIGAILFALGVTWSYNSFALRQE